MSLVLRKSPSSSSQVKHQIQSHHQRKAVFHKSLQNCAMMWSVSRATALGKQILKKSEEQFWYEHLPEPSTVNYIMRMTKKYIEIALINYTCKKCAYYEFWNWWWLSHWQIPCRTAMRGSFPLNGTYFQVNEVRSQDNDISSSRPYNHYFSFAGFRRRRFKPQPNTRPEGMDLEAWKANCVLWQVNTIHI